MSEARMSKAAENSLHTAILEWMKRHNIERGEDCPVLKVSLTGFASDGTPLVKIRPAFGWEVSESMRDGVKR